MYSYVLLVRQLQRYFFGAQLSIKLIITFVTKRFSLFSLSVFVSFFYLV